MRDRKSMYKIAPKIWSKYYIVVYDGINWLTKYTSEGVRK